jgi:hypothetical protein
MPARRKRFWLINKGATKRRRSTSASRKAKRSPPKGFRTWKTYMASIRPKSKGGTVARRRRRRRNTAATVNRPRRRRRRRNPSTVAAVANPRRRRRSSRRRYTVRALSPRRRRRYSRNPSFRARGIMREVKSAFGLALQIEAGKLGTRIVRNYIPGVAQYKGRPLGLLVELGTAIGLGYVGSMAFGARVGANLLAGGVLATLESAIAQYRVPILYDAVSDDGATMTVPATAASTVAGYVDSLGGYVPPSLAGVGDVGGGRGYGASNVPELSFAGV